MLYSALLAANFIGTSSVVVKKETVLAVGGFDETLWNSDDRDLWFRLARQGSKFGFVDRVLHSYRSRSGGVTRRGTHRFPSVLRVLEKQRPHIATPAERRLLEKRIQSVRLGYAWGLRQEGDYDGARAAYQLALSERWSWTGWRGLVLTRLKQWLA
jgi:hypothetical protein